MLTLGCTFAASALADGDAWKTLEPAAVQRLAAAADPAELDASLRAIEAFGPRSIGQPGLERAGDWLAEQVAAMGLQIVGWQTVPVDVPMDKGSAISWTAAGAPARSVPVHAMWPNFVVPPVLPASGLTARVMYAGQGSIGEFDGQDVRGAIVLMEYASADHWLNAASLGAGAVVFLPDREATFTENMGKWRGVPLQFPRFYVADDDAAAALRALACAGGSATLTGGMEWRRSESRNLVALLPANRPAPQPETMIVNVPYDAASVIPSDAAGGQSACTLAAALSVLRALAAESRAHHLLVFFDGARSMGGAGTRAFSAILRDLHATRALQAGSATAGVRERLLRERMKGVKPWMEERRALLGVKAGRLAAAAAWLDGPEDGDVTFAYRDAVRLPRSAWLPHADARTWLQELLKDQVKSRQIATLMSLRDAEREHGADAYAADGEVPEPVRAWRRKSAYYRVVAAEETLEGLLRAMRSEARGVAWTPEDATPENLAREFRDELGEIERQRRVLDQEFALREALAGLEIERHVALDVSAGNSLLTLARLSGVGGDLLSAGQANIEWGFSLGPFVSQRSEILVQQANAALGGAPAFDFVDSVTFNAYRKRLAGAAVGYSVDNEACMAGLSPYKLVTGNDVRLRLMGPGDKVPHTDEALHNIGMQARTAALLLSGLLRHPELWPPAEHIRARTVVVGGKVVVRDPRAGPFPRLPVPGAVVSMPDYPEAAPDAFVTRYKLTDRNGEFRFDDVPGAAVPAMGSDEEAADLALAAFRIAPDSGLLEYAQDQAVKSSTRIDLDRGEVYRRLVCFRGSAMQIYGLSDPMLLAPPTDVKLMAGKGGALENWYLSPADAQAMVALVPPNSRVKILSSVSGYGTRMFLLGDQTTDYAGSGFDAGTGTNFIDTTRAAARNLSALNGTRLEKLVRKGVRSTVATRLHREAGERLDAMEAAASSNLWSTAQYLARDAWGRELRAYPRILELANQAVLAAVMLLAFLAVAAIFLERIALQAGSVYGRIGGAVLLFSGGFALLYLLHPAFQISTTPIIILVAYVIMVLALLAFGVVVGKYTEVMKEWRERTGGIHASDISRAGALAVAFSLGLTNLAKRPLRTGLTILTVALLAFSVMTFTSVETTLDTRFVPIASGDAAPGPDSILFRLYKWEAIPRSMAETFAQDLGPGSEILPRSIKLNARRPWEIGLGFNRFVFSRPETDKTFTAEALPGFMPAEGRFSHLPECVAGRWFSGRSDEVILPTAAAEALGIKAADVDGVEEARQPVIQHGQIRLRVIGILDAAKADAMRDSSGEALSPVDFYASGLFLSAGETDVRNAVGSESKVVFMSFNRSVLLPHSLVTDLGGDLYTMAVRLPPGVGTRAAIQNLMSRIEVNLFASIDGKSYLVKTARSQSVQGAWKLIMPVLLVVLIMVNVMLGTVDERKEEIKMLGAVGLAPRHVTILFLAEASVYGVLGVTFGSLIGLATGWFTRGSASGVDVNYASVPTMVMGLFVLVVVVLATWIPAARAARMATPSGAAKWSLPAKADGRVVITLPFHVTRENGLGVFAFLHEYLHGHRESTSPDFRCQDLSAAIVSDAQGRSAVQVDGQVWPAPYDRRVAQRTVFRLFPADEGGMFRIDVECVRLSGELDAWNQGAFEFLDLIRRQFLIYRTLADDHKRRYVETARELLA